jgi:genome maintenance exonuclease 1
MNLVNRYTYRSMERITRDDGVRHYVDPDTGRLLPSVTTVLDATGDQTGLDRWKRRLGPVKAEQIRQESLALGSEMHRYLDHYATGQSRPRGNYLLRERANRMANAIIEHGLAHVSEFWGSEVMLHASGVYAGTTDLIGLYDGVPAIIDYKTARTMKTRKSVSMQNYFDQSSAYALAHNYCFDSQIKTCVILMVDHTGMVKQFILEGREFAQSVMHWERRMLAYHSRPE